MKFIAVLLMILALFVALVYATGARQIHKVVKIDFNVNDRGDSAEVMKITPSSILDSGLYKDTVVADGMDTVAAVWYSRPQIMRITPSGANGTYYDTLIFAAGTKAGVTWTRAATNSVAYACDSLVALMNAKAVATDSVECLDSGTYVVVKSKRAAKPVNARFSMHLSANLDSAATGHLSAATLNSLKRICDSMAAKVNANAAVAAHLTAANRGDTIWTLTSGKKGRSFAVYKGDAYQDTSTVTPNKASRSYRYDTIPICELISDDWFCNSLYGDIFVHAAEDTNRSLGSSDSCRLWLQSRRYINDTARYQLLDSAKTLLPCSLHISHPNAAGLDTLLKDNLILIFQISDSLSDTNFNTVYPVSIDLLLKEE
jgi:hypothetical protein